MVSEMINLNQFMVNFREISILWWLLTLKVMLFYVSSFVAGKGKHERYYLEINDQSGNPIQLPENERQASVFSFR